MASYWDYVARNNGMADPNDITAALSNWGGTSGVNFPQTGISPVATPVATPNTNSYFGSNYDGSGFNGVGAGSNLAPVTQKSPWYNSGAFEGMLGSTDANGIRTQGWGGLALGVGQGLMNAYLGMQQYGLAKDTFNENKRQFELNYAAKQKTTNAALADRQAARVASNSSQYESVGDYMKKYGV